MQIYVDIWHVWRLIGVIIEQTLHLFVYICVKRENSYIDRARKLERFAMHDNLHLACNLTSA